MIADSTVRDMDTYVHGDTNMIGNFADIRLDYEREFKQGPRFNEVIEMFDKGVDNDITKAFKEWTIDWYWKAFGTYNLGYNFSNWVDDLLTEDED